MQKKLISIVTPCYNESENIGLLIEAIKNIMQPLLDQYDYEHIIIDNASVDHTVQIVKSYCVHDKKVKLIVNARNFGHIRSPYHGVLQAKGDAIIIMASDFQDPVDLIPIHIKNWEEGFKASIAVKNNAEESWFFYNVRKLFYNIISKVSETELIKNYTGAGLYDKTIIDIMRKMDDPYPYFRGMITDLGFSKKIVYFKQPLRKRGFTKNNFFTLFDTAMLGFVNHSKVPLRLATFVGFFVALVSLVVALIYTIYKLIYWDNFQVGMAPLTIGLFFFSAIQLIFIGIIGEYIGAIYTQVKKRPLVVEQERVNFD